MPNILLTNVCNRSCPYCFALAQVAVGTCKPNWEMSPKELESILGYLDLRTDFVSLLGGEPTLHSHFAEIVADIHARHFRIKIFTNGTTAQLRQIPTEIGPDAISIILNLNSPETYTHEEWRQIEANCRFLGEKINLSFNIYKRDFSWNYLRQAVNEWGIGRFIRIGVAQPIFGMANRYLAEEDLPSAYARLVAMSEDLAEDGIRIGLDCGFRACGFSTAQRGTLIQCGAQLLFDCKPVLDIGPELMVWRCFPFSTAPGVKLTDYQSLDAVIAHFEQHWQPYCKCGNTANCGKCDCLKWHTCRGGCLSRTLSLSQMEAFA